MRHRIKLDDLSVKEIMDRWPQTAGTFIAHRMHCVGCPIGPFHTLSDAAEEHRLDVDELTEAITREITANQGRDHRR